jgi:hypothetical protein
MFALRHSDPCRTTALRRDEALKGLVYHYILKLTSFTKDISFNFEALGLVTGRAVPGHTFLNHRDFLGFPPGRRLMSPPLSDRCLPRAMTTESLPARRPNSMAVAAIVTHQPIYHHESYETAGKQDFAVTVMLVTKPKVIV